MQDKKLEVVKSSRIILENKLLLSLDDKETVAILANDRVLSLLLLGLARLADDGSFKHAAEAHELLGDLNRLQREAFGAGGG